MNANFAKNEKAKKVCKALEKRNIKAHFVEDEKQACELVKKLLEKEKAKPIGVFGSVTLQQTGLIEFLKKYGFELINPYEEDISAAECLKRKNNAFYAESVLTGTNAITEEGQLVNVDGLGNRAAAMIYGPKKVIVIAGSNKIVKDVNAGLKRIEEKSAPMNNIRLNYDRPCVKEGHCTKCNKTSNKSICRFTVIIERQKTPERMHVIIIGKELGF